MTIIFNTRSVTAESLSYNPDSDTINIVIDTDDVSKISEIIRDEELLSAIYTETDTYKGYTELKRFAINYIMGEDRYRCYISLETGESTHEKLVKRIDALETAKAELVNDVRNLQKVNLVDLVKEKLIPDDLASALTITGKNDKIIDGYIEIMDEDTSADKQVEGQVSLKDSDGKIVMEGDLTK